MAKHLMELKIEELGFHPSADNHFRLIEFKADHLILSDSVSCEGKWKLKLNQTLMSQIQSIQVNQWLHLILDASKNVCLYQEVRPSERSQNSSVDISWDEIESTIPTSPDFPGIPP